jgi:hypothetical protein
MSYLGNITLEDTVGTAAIKDDAVTADKLANTINTDIATGVTAGTTASAALPKAGGAMTGAITTNSTFDGVDIATRDGVLTSTTTTAGAALPKAGGAMTGAITTNSTFDGRDVATDGTKLDGIASGATAYTHPTTAGNKHIPSGGSSDQVLTYDSSGTAVWADAAGGGGGVPGSKFYTSAGNYTVPSGVTKILITGIGGGGGYGGFRYNAGGGGGSGGRSYKTEHTVNAGTVYAVAVGATGNEGVNNNNTEYGNAGGVSSVGNLVTCNGGGGGQRGNSNYSTHSGGAGGTSSSNGSGGILASGYAGTHASGGSNTPGKSGGGWSLAGQGTISNTSDYSDHTTSMTMGRMGVGGFIFIEVGE